MHASISVKEVEKRGLPVAIAGIPKTIDNDIAVSYDRLYLCFYRFLKPEKIRERIIIMLSRISDVC